MRRAAHRDAAEPAIVAALEAAGATVVRLSAKGVPDLLVGHRGVTYLLEVKTPKASRSGNNGKANAGQAEWRARWRGGVVAVVETPEQALRAIGMEVSPERRPWTKEEREEYIPAPRGHRSRSPSRY